MAVIVLLLLGALGYPGCYMITRVSHGVVHTHWGALGRGGCSRLEPSGAGAIGAFALAPAMYGESAVRAMVDDGWGSCPAITE